jgi:protein arginine N-methyltransferase 1
MKNKMDKNSKINSIEDMGYQEEEVWFPLSEDISEWDGDFHELMLNDHIRMVAYESAIKEVVKPGMTVVDIGTGTGILAFWALEAGAKKVYAVELNKNRIPQAKGRIDKAGYSDRFEIFNDISYDVELPEKVDVIISEILGNLADNEDMTPTLIDARKRFLKEDGIILPKKVKTYLVPVSSEKAHRQVKEMKCKGINEGYGLKDLLNKLDIKNKFDLYYDCVLSSSLYLGEPQIVQEFNFDGSDESTYSVKTKYKVTKDDLFTGFKGSFSAELSDNVILDISGNDISEKETSDCWKHCYLPIENPINVKEGDEINLLFSRSYPGEENSIFRQSYSWKGEVTRDGEVIGKFEQSMYRES